MHREDQWQVRRGEQNAEQTRASNALADKWTNLVLDAANIPVSEWQAFVKRVDLGELEEEWDTTSG